jgi:HAD superfamily hydrolase (TIGR01450 family)
MRFVDRYDLVIFDLDGVVYLGEQPVSGAVPVIAQLHDEGMRCVFATNNASRLAAEVAELLHSIGVPAEETDVVTSAQAAAATLAKALPPATAVLVVGADALRAEIQAVGLTPVSSADDKPLAVVQGYGPDVGWPQLAEATVAIRAGARWVATNGDRTLPSTRGPLPGNGSLIAAVAAALGREPDLVVGKPGWQLFAEAKERAGARRPLVVGDRLDTDIAGAHNAGLDSLLVLTGVSTARSVLDAPPGQRPTAVALGLAGLQAAADEVVVPLPRQGTGGWTAISDGDHVTLTGTGAPAAALATLCALAWSGHPVKTIVAGTEPAAQAMTELGLRS